MSFSASATVVETSHFIIMSLSETSFFVPSSFVVISSSRAWSFSSPAVIGPATACVQRFVLLATVFDALVLYHNRDVHIPFSVLGRLSARLNHKHLSFVALELCEPGVASS